MGKFVTTDVPAWRIWLWGIIAAVSVCALGVFSDGRFDWRILFPAVFVGLLFPGYGFVLLRSARSGFVARHIGTLLVIYIVGQAVLVVLTVWAGRPDPCKNTIKQESASPDGRYVATAFIRDCGATTDFSPQVALHLAGESASPIGNVFIGDHSDKIRIDWLSPTQLVIYADCTVIRQESNFHGIMIEKRALK